MLRQTLTCLPYYGVINSIHHAKFFVKNNPKAFQNCDDNIIEANKLEHINMAKYKVIVPFIDDMGSMSPFFVNDDMAYESKEERALWEINKSRDHDMLDHLEELPKDVIFVQVG